MEKPRPAYIGSEAYVFVSYAHEDAEQVYPEIRRWQEAGTHVWYDEGISPGSEWSEALAEAIRGCASFVFFVSPRAIGSENCRRELIYAQEEHRRVVAVFLEDTDVSPGLRLSLGNRQIIEKHALSEADYRRKLVSAIGPSDAPAGAQAERKQIADDQSRAFPWLAVGGIVAVFAVAVLLSARGFFSEPQSLWTGSATRLTISLPSSQRLALPPQGGYPLSISPDGSRVAYVAEIDGVPQLALRRLDSFSARVLDGTVGARQPFFSPDGLWIGFFSNGKLQRIAVDGGSPLVVASYSGQPGGGSWSADGNILYSSGIGVLRMVSVRDRSSRALDLGDVRVWYPSFFPDGEHALVRGRDSVLLVNVATGEARSLMTYAGGQAQYLNSGHLLFAEQGERVRVVPFDVDSMQITGPPVPVLEPVFRGPGSGAQLFDVSDAGTLVYVRGGFERSLRFADKSGRLEDIAVESRGFRFPRFDPAGQRVAVIVDPRPSHLWVYQLGRAAGTRLTHDGHNILPLWSPDGSSIIYWSDGGIYRRKLDRVAQEAPIELLSGARVGAANSVYPYSLSPDDSVVAVETYHPERLMSIMLLSATKPGPLREYLDTPANERTPQIAPDGRWLAYTSDETGNDELYVRSYPVPGGAVRVSNNGGRDPLWSRDGTELYYREANKAMAVQVTYEPAFAAAEPEALFTAPFDNTQSQNWDVDRAGRFVYVESDPATTREFQVVLNWFSELARLEGD